ncbi:MAG: cyclic nucleotide-binding domain-containing protein [Acidovorax sp.]|nr:cyclic nucleotide-binding domain-containing protein [Acidovorax sp.]
MREFVPLEQVSRMAGLDTDQRGRLAGCQRTQRLAPGETLFRQGDPGDRRHALTAGSNHVFSAPVPGSAAPQQRCVRLSPGMMPGQTAMLEGGGRSGEAVADGAPKVHALDAATMRQWRLDTPLLDAQIHHNIALHLPQRLRAAAWA